jgi:hypothetical protein
MTFFHLNGDSEWWVNWKRHERKRFYSILRYDPDISLKITERNAISLTPDRLGFEIKTLQIRIRS